MSTLLKAALVVVPVVMLGACADDRPQTASTSVGTRDLSQQSAQRIDRTEQERMSYQRDLRKGM